MTTATRHTVRTGCIAFAISLLANCTKANSVPASSASTVTTDSAGNRIVTLPATPGEVVAIPPQRPATQWTVTEYGVGKLRAGMTLKAANDSLHGALVAAAKNANFAECDYAHWKGAPLGVLVMVIENKIARVDIDSTGVTTLEGVGVGSTEAQLKLAYSGRVALSPHAYTDGHYFTVKAINPADSLYRIVFETDKGIVTNFRSGIMPGVEYIEGCS